MSNEQEQRYFDLADEAIAHGRYAVGSIAGRLVAAVVGQEFDEKTPTLVTGDGTTIQFFVVTAGQAMTLMMEGLA